MYLRLTNLRKTFGDIVVLDGASLTLNADDRVALVGPNGCGKTTLIRILAGLEHPDSGAVELSPRTARIGYLPQAQPLRDGACAADAIGSAGLAWALRPTVELAASRLGDTATDVTLSDYGAAWEAFEAAGGHEAADAVENALRGLELDALDPATPLTTLSGGMRTRVALAGLLASQPEVLLLDEPTNHLDLPALEWLEDFVANYPGAVLLVSHDRAFLDATVDRIVELDPATGRLREYVGGYADYAEAKQRELSERWSAYQRQQERISEFEANIRAAESRARGIENHTIAFYYRARARKVARSVVVRKARLERDLDRETRLEKPKAGFTLSAEFGQPAESGRDCLTLTDVVVDLGGKRVLDGIDLLVRRDERVVITGANGSGKTTLLRTVTGELTPKSGAVKLGAGVVLGYFAQAQENLDLTTTPLELVRATDGPGGPLDETQARRFLHRFLFSGDEVFVPASRLSHGQRARLLLAKLVLLGTNLLLLDEPLSHLDLTSRERFESALLEFGGTIVAVLHDRYTIERLATRVLRLEGGRLVML